MSKIYHLIFASLLAFLFFACTPASKIGNLFSNEEANQLFGNVIYSVEINSNELYNLLDKTEENIMFGLINKNLIILGDNRKLIYPEKAEFKESDVFTIYSKDIVKELLTNSSLKKQKSNEPEVVSVEQRREVLSVSTDTQTLETGHKCPPSCFD